jgi:hypothetical protein
MKGIDTQETQALMEDRGKKVTLSLSLIMHYVWRNRFTAPPFLTSEINGGECSNWHAFRLNPGRNPPASIIPEAGLASVQVWSLRKVGYLLPVPAIKPRFHGLLTSRLFSIPTELNRLLKKQDKSMWIGFRWLGIGSSCGLLWTRSS